MHKPVHLSFVLQSAGFIAALLLTIAMARAQVSGGPNVNTSKMPGYQAECAMANNPNNKLQLFALCNNLGRDRGLFAARSVDGGATWIYPDPSKTIANGSMGLGPAACCDPSLAWDSFGNLFLSYIDHTLKNVVTLLSTDSGQTFTTLQTFGPASVDQPTAIAAAGQIWVIWNQSGSMVARGAAVTGLGTGHVGAFIALQSIPGTSNCSFGDIAIAPSGAVVQVCQSPAGGTGPGQLLVNIKADGLGPNPFGSAITATSTNVGAFYPIPAQSSRTIDAESGLAFDRNPLSPHFGRLYLVYTDAPTNGSADTDIYVRFSDDNGATWSARTRINDDTLGNGKSQFFPRIVSNPLSGNVAVCWYDARNSSTNTAIESFCSIATPSGATPAFMANAQIGAALSTSSANPNQFGDYSGLAYLQGQAFPIWPDTSNSTGDNPDGTTEFDIYTARVVGGPLAQEGTAVATHDFDGNWASDIAWRDTASNTAFWFMNGGTIASSASFGAVPGWSIVGQRDFNGDGKHDLLWRDAAGNTAIWFMNGGTIASSASLGAVPGWSVVGTGDFNGDGKGDILWRDTSGNTAVWLMNGGTIASSASLGAVSTLWSIVGTADFNGDDKGDILWRDNSGNTAIWFMNGGQVFFTASLGAVSTTWTIVGTGDFNGDGKSDILWRDSSGNTAIWFMNGGTIASSANLGAVVGWTIAATGDFNGDGKGDILWRDGSGNTAMWFMNGGTIASSANLGAVSISWTIQGNNAD